MTHWNGELLAMLEPLGRAGNGGLLLRSPPGRDDLRRFENVLRRALADVGDRAAALAAIVEGPRT
jgi:hypothetical protein